MQTFLNPVEAAPAIQAMLDQTQRILILSHVSPDGDAIGCMLASWHALRSQGKTVYAVASSMLPDLADMLPGHEHVTIYASDKPLPECDLVWMVDTSTVSRIGMIYNDHKEWLQSVPILIIDHHATNEGEGSLALIDAKRPSCAELLTDTLRAMDIPITPEIATCLLMGVYTDTLSFQTPVTTAQSLRVAADLFDAGADRHAVIEAATTVSLGKLQFTSSVVHQMHYEDSIAWTVASQEMVKEAGLDPDHIDTLTDDVVNIMRNIQGVSACVLFKERSDGTVKISMRSRPGINVARVAKTVGGGGHINAAGATMVMSIDKAIDTILPVLRAAVNTVHSD